MELNNIIQQEIEIINGEFHILNGPRAKTWGMIDMDHLNNKKRELWDPRVQIQIYILTSILMGMAQLTEANNLSKTKLLIKIDMVINLRKVEILIGQM